MGATVEQALEQLKSTGVRMTPQRHAILSFLMHSKSHPTADEIYKSLSSSFPSMSVATIYNNLRLFVDAGLIKELTYGDDSSRFDADLSEHYHAICRSCGTIVDFDHPPLTGVEEAASRVTGFRVEGHRMEIYGQCATCASRHN
ncbi:Fur family transcriptional regulator [Paenibacillus sp. R14(2021)]|uniref:Fur family transcriptional regulator n=1 Tax=Paenibacillus sp. R14(2021) TaxID=2859228 RepID=UPI001C612FD7|nr:Fur family transcriptional regulator [Paenibacillus sp. R14(2021)]